MKSESTLPGAHAKMLALGVASADMLALARSAAIEAGKHMLARAGAVVATTTRGIPSHQMRTTGMQPLRRKVVKAKRGYLRLAWDSGYQPPAGGVSAHC